MGATGMTVEKACAGQDIGASADRPKEDVATRHLLQPDDLFAGKTPGNINTGHHDHQVKPVLFLDRPVGQHGNAIAGTGRFAFGGKQLPGIEFSTGQLVGHAEWLNGRGKGNQGEIIDQQEADPIGFLGGLVCV